MRLWNGMKKTMLAFLMCLCLCSVAAPGTVAYAAAEQVENQVEHTEAADDDGSMMILMGGALLIIIVAVVVAVSTASSAIFVAANMDIDGE